MATNLDHGRVVTTVLQLVSHLGGPECTPEDIDWAVDIPAGKQLLEWLASQTLDYPEQGDRPSLESVVSPFVLYPEEQSALTALADGGAGSSQQRPSAEASSQYELPSQLRTRTRATEAEAELLERQAARLKYRLNASKKVAKELKETIHVLRKQVQSADETIQEQQVRLADLSVQTDGVIARVTNLALQVLPAAGTDDDIPIEAFGAHISTLNTSRAAVSAAAKQLYQALDDGYTSLPNAADLQRDAELVRSKLNAVDKGRGTVQRIVDTAYVEELERITERIEASQDPRVITRMCDITSSNGMVDLPSLEVDVKAELETAGRLDRLALLRAQEQGLDTIAKYVREDLVPRLQQTYDTLHATRTVSLETEAIVSALIEELEDVNDAVDNARYPATFQQHKVDDPEAMLETQIVELLKGLLGSETDKPTVLLDRSDVEAELSSLVERLDGARRNEEALATGLRSRLGRLSHSTAPLLSAAYKNSPVNTSPPFAPGAPQVALQNKTRTTAEDLMGAAARLQKESELTSRDKRKLGTFVEKWMID